jgi:hypothetical protein
MNRTTTALLAALEALIVVAIGVGIALVPLTLLWATHFELAVDWTIFWHAAADVWLLGNGVDLTVQLPATVAAAFALPGAELPFTLSIALLGFAVLAFALGVRTGIRATETPHTAVGVFVAIVSYGVFTALIAFSSGNAVVTAAQPQAIILPTLIYTAGVLAGAFGVFGRAGHTADAPLRSAKETAGTLKLGRLAVLGRSIRERYFDLPVTAQSAIAESLRGGAAAAVAIVGVAALVVAILILANFATIIGLYEAVQAGAMGGATLTVVQLALLPNLVIWAAAWLIGPGFAVGAGTGVSPVGTSLGAVPGLPIFGALPHGAPAGGFLWLLVPVLIGFGAALLIRRRSDRAGRPAPTLTGQLAAGGGMGLVGGLLLGLAAWAAAGSLGPGRLAEVGPNPLLVGLLAAVEIGIAACLGMLAGSRDPASAGRVAAASTRASASSSSSASSASSSSSASSASSSSSSASSSDSNSK